MKIIKITNGIVSVDALKDGEIAVIKDWNITSYIGGIVQRYGDDLITLGMPQGHGWSSFFKSERHSGCTIQKLAPGTQIEL